MYVVSSTVIWYISESFVFEQKNGRSPLAKASSEGGSAVPFEGFQYFPDVMHTLHCILQVSAELICQNW